MPLRPLLLAAMLHSSAAFRALTARPAIQSLRSSWAAAAPRRGAPCAARFVMSTKRCDTFLDRIAAAEQAARPLIGSWNCIGSPEVTEVLADAGMDFVCLDMEHSCMSIETVAHNIRAATAAMAPPVVRVPGMGPGQHNNKEIMRVLDLGCSAVIVPGVQTKEQCEEAVAASLFPKPLAQVGGGDGFRGANPFVRAGRHGLEAPAAYHRSSNEQILVIPLLETAEALANVEEIMQVVGLRVAAFGPFDLSVAMGFDGVRTPEVEAALMTGVRAALKYGVRPMLPVLDASEEETGNTLRRWRQEGVHVFTVGVDKALLGRTAKAFLQACR